jgi:hypothetical protein
MWVQVPQPGPILQSTALWKTRIGRCWRIRRAESKGAEEIWLPVIGRALVYLCLKHAEKEMPKDFSNVLDKVKFLTELGLPEAEAAYGAGSNPKSVQVMRSQKKARGRARKK